MSYIRLESDPFHLVEKFEDQIANFYGAKYGIATDSCTHAIELCLRYEGFCDVTCPEHTYISVPFTFKKLNLNWKFEDNKWEELYKIGGTNIIDGAVLWRKNSYISGTYLCLSFQYNKHLSVGRGGMILTDDEESYNNLKKMAYDGRVLGIPWGDQDIDTMGYHYYMTPEIANKGITQFNKVKDFVPKSWGWTNYPYLPDMKVFK